MTGYEPAPVQGHPSGAGGRIWAVSSNKCTRALWAFTVVFLLHGRVQGQPVSLYPEVHSFTFAYANDFFRATDRYFTQGVRLELVTPIVERLPARWLLPALGNGIEEGHSLFLEQNCYTPRSIRRDTVVGDDRPFAAAMFLGQRRTSVDTEHGRALSSAILIGVLGPCALCAEEQRAIHAALDNIAPLGWEFQVAGDILVNVDMDVQQRLFRNSFLELSAAGIIRAGTFHDRLGASGLLEVGRFRSRFGTEQHRYFEWSVFASGRSEVVGYDATLQGGVFNHTSVHSLPHQEVEHFVGRGELGLRARVGNYLLSFAHVYTTRDFRNGMPHAWGDARISVSW